MPSGPGAEARPRSSPVPGLGADPPGTGRPARWGRGSRAYAAASALLLAAGIAGLAWAMRSSWRETHDRALPGWPLILLAVVGMLAFLVLSEQGWAALFEGRVDRRRLARSYYLSQLGKYIPGGIWQPAGQVGLSVGESVTTRRAALTFGLFLAQLMAAALLVAGLGLAFLGAGLPVAVRVVAGVAGSAGLAFRRPVAEVVSRLVPVRWRPDLGGLPAPDAFRRGLAWSTAAMVAQGAAFGVLLLGTGAGGRGPWSFGPAFVAAWLAGFVAVPVPTGVGIREAVLVALLGHHVPVASILVASLAQRLAGGVADVLAVGVAAAATRTPHPATGTEPGR